MIFKTSPKPKQHWAINGRQYRILTITRPEPPPKIVETEGYSMHVKVWGGEDETRKLYREITLPGERPKPWAGKNPRASALTWMSQSKESWVVFYRLDEGTVYWGLPRDVFVKQFEYINPHL